MPNKIENNIRYHKSTHFGDGIADAVQFVSDIFSAEVAEIYLVSEQNPNEINLVATTSSIRKKRNPINFATPKAAGGLTAYHAYWFRSHDRSNSPILMNRRDIAKNRYAIPGEPNHIPSKKYVSRMVFPLRDRKGIFEGLVVVDNRKTLQAHPNGETTGHGSFSRSDTKKARAVKETLERSLERRRFLSAIERLSSFDPADRSLDAMLSEILIIACRAIKADRGDFFGPDKLGHHTICLQQFTLCNQTNPSEAGEKTTAIQLEETLPSKSFVSALYRSSKDILVSRDVRKLRSSGYHKADEKTRSEIALKFKSPKGRVYLINLESYELRFFDMEDQRLLRLLLRQVEAYVAQDEAREAVTLYKDLIFEHMQEMVFVKDIRGRFVFVSDSLARFLNPTNPSAVIGKTDEDFFKNHPVMADDFHRADMKAIRSGKELGWFYEICQPDAQTVPRRIHTFKAPVFESPIIAKLIKTVSGDGVRTIKSENGKQVIGIIGIFHDVSHGSQLSKAQDLTKSASVMWRKKTDRVDVSETVWNLFEIPESERIDGASIQISVIIEKLVSKIDPQDNAALAISYAVLVNHITHRQKEKAFNAITLEKPVVFKLRGKRRWLKLIYENSFEIPNDSDSEVSIVVIEDVTELQNTISNLIDAKERMQRANDSLVLGALAHATLHDAKRPIDLLPPVVENMVYALEKFKSVPEQSQVELVEKALHRLNLLKEQCLIARDNIAHLRLLSIDPNQIKKDKVDVWKIVQECIWSQEPVAMEHGIKIVLRMNGGSKRSAIPLVSGDKLALRVAFGNLITNSIRNGCPDGSAKRIVVLINFDRDLNKVRLECRDSGPGFPPAIIQHMKEPFSVPVSAHGMGFGLLISRTLFRLMGGRFEIGSGPGAPCSITLQIVDEKKTGRHH